MADQETDVDGAESDAQATSGGERGERSGTRYPFYGLEVAQDFAKAVQQTGGKDVREEDLLVHLQVSRTTKSWIYKLSTAREFGLIERKGQKADARIALTDLASRLLMPADQAELTASRMAAFLTPPLYQKLFERYKGAPVPQSSFLANLLVREHKLLESVAMPAAEAFIDTARFAGLVENGKLLVAAGKGEPLKPEDKGTGGGNKPPKPAADGDDQQVAVPADFIAHVFQLRKDLKVTIPLPPDISNKDVARLHKWLQTLPIEDDTEATP